MKKKLNKDLLFTGKDGRQVIVEIQMQHQVFFVSRLRAYTFGWWVSEEYIREGVTRNNNVEIASRMLRRGDSPESITEVLSLSLDEVLSIQKALSLSGT